jgi:hypothetical protein
MNTIDTGTPRWPGPSIVPNRMHRAVIKKAQSRRKKVELSLISVGENRITTADTIARIKSDAPSSTEIPMWIPSEVAPSEADRLANTSGAPAPNANKVTPAKLSDNLKVFEICCKAGLKNSSALTPRQVKVNNKKKIPSG